MKTATTPASLSLANRLAPPEHRSQVISTYFVAANLGLIIPVIGVGTASQHSGYLRATLACAAVITGPRRPLSCQFPARKLRARRSASACTMRRHAWAPPQEPDDTADVSDGRGGCAMVRCDAPDVDGTVQE